MEFFDPFDGPDGIVPGGVPSFSDLADAAFDQTLLVSNVGGSYQAKIRAYAEINRKVKETFGLDLPNPAADWDTFDQVTGERGVARNGHRETEAVEDIETYHQRRLAELQAQDGERFKAAGLDQPLEDRITAVMRGVVQRNQELGSRAQGTFKPLLASLWGGLRALPYDPVQVGSLFVGGGATIAGRIAIAGGVNAGVEAVSYPFTTGQKERAGLETGLGDLAKDMAVAGVFGAGLQGAGEAVGAGARALMRNIPEAPKPGQKPAAADPVADPVAMPEAQPAPVPDAPAMPAPDMDPLAARGADLVRAADDEALRVRPEPVLPDDHARALRETVRFLDEPGAPAPIMPEIVRDGAPALPAGLDGPVASTFDYLGKSVQRRSVDPRALTFDPDRFQYKGGGDARGVTDRLSGVDKWDNLAAQAVVVFEQADGRLIVADGHQRTGLAQRLLKENLEPSVSLEAFVLREADGWTADQVFAVATKRNLQQGTGDVTDTAVALQRLPEVLDKSVARGNAHMRTAQGLARLDPDLLALVRAGGLSQEAGKVIGYKLPDPAQQRAAVAAIQARNIKGEDVVSGFIDEMKASQMRVETTFDLFGEAEITRTLAVEMAELKVKVAELLKQNAKAFKRVNEAADMLEARSNRIARDVNASVSEASNTAAEYVRSLSIDPGPMRDMMMAGAQRMAAGEKLAKVARDVAKQIADATERDGIDAMLPRPVTLQGVKQMTPKIDDPTGPAAKQRADAMERSLRGEVDAARQRTDAELPKEGNAGDIEKRAEAAAAGTLDTGTGGADRGGAGAADQGLQASPARTDGPAGGPARLVEKQGRTFVDTRGAAVQYHGSSVADLKPIDEHYSSLNYYGTGFYTTDAVDVAWGYSKRGSDRTGGRELYQVVENRPLRILDGEAAFEGDIKLLVDDLRGRMNDNGDLGDIVLAALDENPRNLRELYDNIRDIGTNDYNWSADSIQEAFDVLRYGWEQAGYDGLAHLGGLRTKTEPHRVVVYFAPQRDLTVTKASYNRFDPPAAPAPAAEPGAEGMPQLLLDGVAPVRDADRMALEAARPLRGGDAAPPEGGLFDDAARDQGGLFDMVPGQDAGRIIDGVAAAGELRTRQQVLDDLDRLDAENTLLDACLKG
jgi:hypothetical protein